jgi:hypothetical protein
VLEDLIASNAPGLDVFFENWREKLVWQRKAMAGSSMFGNWRTAASC